MNQLQTFAAVAAWLLTAPSSAQEAAALPASKLSPVRVPLHTAEADPIGGKYGVWAAGDDYKVGFHGDMTFVPMLGVDYPHSQPWAWRTTSVEVGGAALFDSAELAERDHTEFRYEYRHRHFVEAYDVLAEGLEQTFVFARPLPDAGDLVLRGQVVSGLVAQQMDLAHRELVFHDGDGAEILRYGRAFVLDAAGRRLEIATAHDDGEIRLVVPAHFLREANYPIVVDPLIRVSDLVTSSPVTGSPDLAFDAGPNDYFVVHTRNASAGDSDVYGVTYRAGSFTNGMSTFADLTTSWETYAPVVATAHANPRKFVLAIQRRFPLAMGASRSAVRVHVKQGRDYTFGNQVLLIDPGAGFQDRIPDVGGTDLSSNGRWAMLVFQREALPLTNARLSEVVALPLDVSTQALGRSFFVQPVRAGFGIYDTERPSINRVARPPRSGATTWVVVFQQDEFGGLFPPQWQLVGRQISSDGTQSATHWSPSVPAPATHRMGGRIAGHPTINNTRANYGVVYTELQATGASTRPPFSPWGTRIVFERLEWPSGGGLRRYAPVTHRTSSEPELRVRGIVYDDRTTSHWTFSHVGGDNQGRRVEGGLTRVGFDGHRLRHEPFPGNPAIGFVAGGIVVEGGQSRTTVWQDWTSLRAGSLGYPGGGLTSTSGPGCSAASIGWWILNSQDTRFTTQIGNAYTSVRVIGAPPNVGHFLLLSLGTARLDLSGLSGIGGGCHLLVQTSGPSYLGALGGVATGPEMSWDLPLPSLLIPATLHFQGWHYDGSGRTLRSTERLSVGIVR